MPSGVESKLGRIEQVHRIRRNLRRNRLTAAVILFGLGVVAWLFAAGRAYVALVEYGPLLVGRWAGTPMLVGIGLWIVSLGLGLGAWRSSRVRIRVHSGGLAMVRGRRGRALLWGDIQAVWSRAVRTGLPGLPSRLHQSLEIEARDGARLRLDDRLEDFGTLAEAVKGHVYPAMLEASTRAFNEGKPLHFGPIELSREGITDHGKVSYPWGMVSDARFESGRLVVQTQQDGKSAEIGFPANRIPNVELCAQLIQEIGRPQ